MSRKSTKFFPFYITDLKIYFKFLLGKKLKKKFTYLKRNKTLNFWNIFRNFSVHQGRFVSFFFKNEYLLGYKAGELSKTRKPFFFRGKKK